jgi:hypothetical protein
MVVPLPADVVVLELPAEHATDARAAVDSCRQVLGVGQCRSVGEAGGEAGFLAFVEWQAADLLRARVSVQPRHGVRPRIYIREIEFSAEDTLTQRYRAIGLLIVSYVVAELAARPASTPPHASPRLPSSAQQPAALQAAAPLQFGIDLGGHLGPGVTSSWSRAGAFVRPWLSLAEGLWRPFVRLGWMNYAEAVELDGFEGALGLAVGFDLGSAFGAELGLSGVAQHLRFRASDERLGTDRASLNRYGARVGVEADWRMAPPVGAFVGVDLLTLSPGYTLKLQDQVLGREEGPKWSILLGVRFAR